MQTIDVVVATAQEYMQPHVDDRHLVRVVQEDTLILEALHKTGLTAVRKGWDDPDFDWRQARAVLIRTTWNYSDHLTKFEAWLREVAKNSRLFNPLDIVLWNINKRYLEDLEDQGIHVVPTIYASLPTQLARLMSEQGWEEVVIKPVVSAGAVKTYRVHRQDVKLYQPILDQLVSRQEMMIQPFQEDVVAVGEKSCIVIARRFSHALRKIPKGGDFRVQESYGGRLVPYQLSPEEKNFVDKTISIFPQGVIYGRIDFVRDNQGKLAIMELELIEPELFFRLRPESADELAAALKERLRVKEL